MKSYITVNLWSKKTTRSFWSHLSNKTPSNSQLGLRVKANFGEGFPNRHSSSRSHCHWTSVFRAACRGFCSVHTEVIARTSTSDLFHKLKTGSCTRKKKIRVLCLSMLTTNTHKYKNLGSPAETSVGTGPGHRWEWWHLVPFKLNLFSLSQNLAAT